MKLDDSQKQKITSWIEQGLKLSEIQKRLETELSLHMTYLDVRLLVDELNLKPKDPVVPKPVAPPTPAPAPTTPEPQPASQPQAAEPEAQPAGGNVSVTMDTLTQPGSVASGKVTFSDGVTATWLLDQSGRLGLGGAPTGYRPSPSDIQMFQMELQNQLQKLGY